MNLRVTIDLTGDQQEIVDQLEEMTNLVKSRIQKELVELDRPDIKIEILPPKDDKDVFACTNFP